MTFPGDHPRTSVQPLPGFTVPALGEIYRIAERRRRTRQRLAFGSVAALVTIGTGAGMSALRSADTGGLAQPAEAPVTEPSTPSTTDLDERRPRLDNPPTHDPGADEDNGAETGLAGESPCEALPPAHSTIEQLAVDRAGYSVKQQRQLAAAWGVDDAQVITMAGAAILAGVADEITDIVGDPEHGPENAFWDAGYSVEQIVELADEWQVDQFEAKKLAGTAILSGEVEAVTSLVGEPDRIDVAEFEAAGYSIEQFYQLAMALEVSLGCLPTVAGDLILSGRADELEAIVGPPAGPDPPVTGPSSSGAP